jgi:hypothetical protein
MRLFLASPKGMPDDVAQHLADGIKSFLQDKATVELASEVFETHFAAVGGWSGWSDFVSCGVNSYTREPTFTGVVCVEPVLGKGTAQIVEKCLAHKKPVLYWKGEKLSVVIDLKADNPEDWFGGWSLVYRE